MTHEEQARKFAARYLIKLPVDERPNTVKYTPATAFGFAYYTVDFGDITSFFQHDGKRLCYLGGISNSPENYV